MMRLVTALAACVFLMSIASAHDQPVPVGTLVIVPGEGEVKHANDQAHLTLMIEEQDKDKAAAASRVNRKMKQGTEIVRKADPAAVLKTRGYYTTPVYSDDRARTTDGRQQLIGWRVGQYLDVTTNNVGALPATVAAAQSVLALNGLYFGLSDEATKALDKQGIEAAYRNLTERVATLAKAMAKNTADATYESIELEGAGGRAPQPQMYAAKAMRGADAAPVAEPDFEPGETTLVTHIVGKVRFK